MSDPLPTGPDESKLARRVAALSLEQKVRLLTGADFWSLHSEPAVGLRRLVVSDGPAGVRGEVWDEREPSANVPSPTALAATWDEQMVRELGAVLAFEARRKGVHVLLAPTVNLHRTPHGGRHFECFSEDPLLTARIGVAYVRGIQDWGVGATVKHFVANDSETQRMTLDARVDERTLREVYLAPFEAIVRDAGVWAVMAAYNRVNGHSMTESPLLDAVLRDEWGFDGVTMSDWFATRSTEAAANAGLDLAMPGPHSPWGEALAAAVHAGRVAETTIDKKVLRLLRLAARVGALKGMPARVGRRRYNRSAVAAELRRVAAAGFVLIRNENGALPLASAQLRRVAVLGPNAEHARTLGGGSATVFPPYSVSPLKGLRRALAGQARVTHAVGVQAQVRTPPARSPWLWQPDTNEPGVRMTFVHADGSILATEARQGGSYTWLGAFGPDLPRERVAQIRVHTQIRATKAGRYDIGGSACGRLRLDVDRKPVFDDELSLPDDADVLEAIAIPPQRLHGVHLDVGQAVDVVLTYDVPVGAMASGAITAFHLNLGPPYGGDEDEVRHAVRLARAADVAVVVVGTTDEVESEGFDRASLALPGRQDELIRRVAAANARTIVVVNSGAPVLMPWADDVAAILLTWFPGQEFGNALADVLLGQCEPGGRLPTTWPDTEQGLPSTRPSSGGTLRYAEGLHIGYRRPPGKGPTSRYPFGHGLGYTTWAYLSVDAPRSVPAARDVDITVRLRNTGGRRGREVVQVYLSRPDSAIERPVRWLAGFAVIDGDPAEELAVVVTVSGRSFQHWRGGTWDCEPGAFHLEVGPSSVHRPLATVVTIGAVPPKRTRVKAPAGGPDPSVRQSRRDVGTNAASRVSPRRSVGT